MNSIDVSIILPVYNNENTLKRALDSVFSQVFNGSFELICAIDPSKDDSLSILEEYSKKHPNLVLLVSKERLGTALSRQKAIEIAKGKYVAFLDADDELRNDFLQKMFDAIVKKDADVVNCSFYVVYGTRNKKVTYPFRRNATLRGKAILRSFYMDACIRGFMWSKMYRKEILSSLPRVLLASPKDMFEDQALNGTLLAKCNKVILLRKPLYYYYKNNAASLSSVKRTDRAQRHLAIFALHRHFFENTQNSIALKAFRSRLFRMSWTLSFDIKIDKKNGASKEYIKTIRDEWKNVRNLKKPLPIEGKSYEELFSRAILS